jgi:hypothetical protein
MTSSKHWKNGLLKTGLPLEYVVSSVLNKKGHEVFGTYPYIRPDESKTLKEFSVDLRTFKCIDSKDRLIILSMLVECKYRQPDTSWIFSPFPSKTVPIGLIQSSEDLVPVRLNSDSLWKYEESTNYCISGVELNKNGDGKADGIKHGVFQLRFAMPVLLKNTYEGVMKHVWSEGRNIDLICPILVTTAELRLIKPDLNLHDFTQAEDLDDVTDVRDSIILNEKPGPQLQEFADLLADEFIKNHPQLPKRLSELDSVLVGKEWEKRLAPDIDTIRRSFGYSTERILVVNYNSFEKVLGELETTIKKEIEDEKVYGKVISTEEGYLVISI